jgi:outer membrane protein assembly factor BamB
LATSYAENTLQVDLASGTQAAVKGRRLCQRVTAQARQIDHAELAELASHKQSWALVDGVSVVGLAHGPGAVPTLHGYAGQPREAKWQSVLLPSVKAGVLIVGADYADIAAGRAFVGYWHTSDRKPWVLALDASSGKELWRAPIDSPGSTLTSVSASATRVYVIVGDFLVVFDAASGKVVLDFGTGDSD